MALGAVIRRNQPRFGAERSGLLQQARLAGPMPWVIAIMVALTVMAAAAGLALSNVASNASSEISGGLTSATARPRSPSRCCAIATMSRKYAACRTPSSKA